MITDNERKEVRDRLPEYLQLKGIDINRPFTCLNPAHPDRHPSMVLDTKSPGGPYCHCFSCGANYDLYHLIGVETGTDNFAEQYNTACEVLGIVNEHQMASPATRPSKETAPSQSVRETAKTTAKDTPPDLTAEIEKAHAELLATPSALNYLQGRGLTLETIKRFKLGYTSGGYNAFFENHPEKMIKDVTPGLFKYVHPLANADGSVNSVIFELEDRAQENKTKGISKYKKIANTETPFFNQWYLTDPENTPPALFVTEGIYDAISVEQAGGHALALLGTGFNKLVDLVKKYKPKTVLILSLDADKPGQATAEKLNRQLNELNLPTISAPAQNNKDFNEFLQTDPDGFYKFIKETEEKAKGVKGKATEEYTEQTTAGGYLQKFIDTIEVSKTAFYYPTGFKELDAVLDGGLFPGLYILGAISALGKTTFLLQLADNIAETGQDVLVFSFEMSKSELIAKSVSRQTFLNEYEPGKRYITAKTARGITTGTRYANYTAEEKETISTAILSYSKFAEHVFIFDALTEPLTAKGIEKAINNHIKLTGHVPVVFVDYLQIVSPENPRATDKQNTDATVVNLRRASAKYGAPIVAVSSFNRENYNAPVNMASFKESGAIEYSADVLVGLQYAGLDYEPGETELKRATRVRELLAKQSNLGKSATEPQQIEVKILKNRNGARGSIVLDFWPMFNTFKDKSPDPIDQAEWVDL